MTIYVSQKAHCDESDPVNVHSVLLHEHHDMETDTQYKRNDVCSLD